MLAYIGSSNGSQYWLHKIAVRYVKGEKFATVKLFIMHARSDIEELDFFRDFRPVDEATSELVQVTNEFRLKFRDSANFRQLEIAEIKPDYTHVFKRGLKPGKTFGQQLFKAVRSGLGHLPTLDHILQRLNVFSTTEYEFAGLWIPHADHLLLQNELLTPDALDRKYQR